MEDKLTAEAFGTRLTVGAFRGRKTTLNSIGGAGLTSFGFPFSGDTDNPKLEALASIELPIVEARTRSAFCPVHAPKSPNESSVVLAMSGIGVPSPQGMAGAGVRVKPRPLLN